MVFRAVVFTFVPTALELVLVCGLLARSFAPQVAAMVLATFGAYVAWTTALTSAGLKVLYLTTELLLVFHNGVTSGGDVMRWLHDSRGVHSLTGLKQGGAAWSSELCKRL